MKATLIVTFLLAAIASFASPPLLLKPNSSQIELQGGPSDTAITLPRLLLVATTTYSEYDSMVTVTFNGYVNLKEARAGNACGTNVPLTPPRFKSPTGNAITLTAILQQTRQYYISLGYLATIQ